MKPAAQQKQRLTLVIEPQAFDAIREAAFEENTTSSRLAATVLEKWVEERNSQPRTTTEGA